MTSTLLIPPGASGNLIRFPAGRHPEACTDRDGIEIRRAGTGELAVRAAAGAGASEPSGWLLNYTASLEDAGCIIPNNGADLARAISDILPRNIEKAGEPEASDFADSGTQDLDVGFSLNASTFKASRDLAGMRTAWYSLQKRLVYEKEEVNHFDRDAPKPGLPRRLTDLLPPGLIYFRLLTIVREAADAERGEILIGVRTLPQLIELSDQVRQQGRCAREDCLMGHKGTFISPLITVVVNDARMPLAPSTRLGELIGSPYASLRVWKPYRGRLTPVDFRGAGLAIEKLQLTGGERIRFTQKP